MSETPRGDVFRYESFAADAEQGLLTCRYSLDGRSFSERVSLAPGPRWNLPAARAAARLVFLLAGVSYYKTAAPPVIDLGGTPLSARERDFLRDFYLQGLGEYAYRNALDLTDIRCLPPQAEPRSTPAPARPCGTGGRRSHAAPSRRGHRVLRKPPMPGVTGGRPRGKQSGRWCRSGAGSTRS